jgi:hypothetical protein
MDKMARKTPTSSISRPSKIYPNLDFLVRKIYHLATLVQNPKNTNVSNVGKGFKTAAKFSLPMKRMQWQMPDDPIECKTFLKCLSAKIDFEFRFDFAAAFQSVSVFEQAYNGEGSTYLHTCSQSQKFYQNLVSAQWAILSITFEQCYFGEFLF